jgi:thiol-disulfide isomerase/thioredoxin
VRLAIVAAACAAVLALAGCTASEDLANQYSDGSGQGYISGDGAYTEIPADQRGEPIVFSGLDERAQTITSDDFAGSVYVVNFWYASCPPCRVEAPELAAVSADYPDVPFLGVNISDSADVAITFAEKFGVPYPSIIDNATAGVQLAFAGSVAPNAVPTTVILDRQGRVAARISGVIQDASILESMIDTVVAEEN